MDHNRRAVRFGEAVLLQLIESRPVRVCVRARAKERNKQKERGGAREGEGREGRQLAYRKAINHAKESAVWMVRAAAVLTRALQCRT